MKTLIFGQHALSACVAVSILAGCGTTPLSPSAAGITAKRTRPSVTYGVLYSFKGGYADGYNPLGGLVSINGTLYGTTAYGGSCGGVGCGTVFKVTPSGAETVLHSFAGGPGDGAYPFAGLINVKGTLYGTTFEGGANNFGTVFKITTSGTETVLHSFGPYNSDGAFPSSPLLNVNGMLYGTTQRGGVYYCGATCGTVFSITTSGAERVLYSFKGTPDGYEPGGGLINVNGTLYGTTYAGGTNADGTVFSITTSGTETLLHSFKDSPDGYGPAAGLINVNGTLYGTTCCGGTHGRAHGGWGTVFSIATSGKETVLYSFQNGSGDGAHPRAALINVKGMLYGTTAKKGENNHGTLFAVTTSGTETVLHNFGGPGDGAEPLAGLTKVNGTLYGTTYLGGANFWGTVFKLSQ